MAAQAAMTPLSSRATAFSVAALMASDSGPRRQEVSSARARSQSAFHRPQSKGRSQRSPPKVERLSGDSARAERQSVQLESNGIQVILQESALWRRFYGLGTEMIVTKAGRRMFPILEVDILGLEPHKTYSLLLDVVLVENKRYKYAYHDSQWLIAGKADPPPVDPPSVYVHPESPASGHHWMKQTVHFDKVKLTNNETSQEGQLVLNSMHKYRPRLRIVQVDEDGKELGEANHFTFPETEFIAVTAYQNQQITKLKIDCNPFAKGFRESRATARFAVDSCLEAFYAYKTHSKAETGDNAKSLPSEHHQCSDVTSPVSDHMMSHCQSLPQIKSGFTPLVPVTPPPIGVKSPANEMAFDMSPYHVCNDFQSWRLASQVPFTPQTPQFRPLLYECRPAFQTVSQLVMPTDQSRYCVEEGCYSAHTTPYLTLAQSAPDHLACLKALTNELRWAERPITQYCYPIGLHSGERPTPYDRPRPRMHRRRHKSNSSDDNPVNRGSV